ncbi:hypothetical protein [Streptomyces sp. NPDC055085]
MPIYIKKEPCLGIKDLIKLKQQLQKRKSKLAEHHYRLLAKWLTDDSDRLFLSHDDLITALKREGEGEKKGGARGEPARQQLDFATDKVVISAGGWITRETEKDNPFWVDNNLWSNALGPYEGFLKHGKWEEFAQQFQARKFTGVSSLDYPFTYALHGGDKFFSIGELVGQFNAKYDVEGNTKKPPGARYLKGSEGEEYWDGERWQKILQKGEPPWLTRTGYGDSAWDKVAATTSSSILESPEWRRFTKKYYRKFMDFAEGEARYGYTSNVKADPESGAEILAKFKISYPYVGKDRGRVEARSVAAYGEWIQKSGKDRSALSPVTIACNLYLYESGQKRVLRIGSEANELEMEEFAPRSDSNNEWPQWKGVLYKQYRLGRKDTIYYKTVGSTNADNANLAVPLLEDQKLAGDGNVKPLPEKKKS